MKTTTLIWFGVGACAFGLTSQAQACPFCHRKTTGLFIGEAAIMGNGTVHSWAYLDKNGKPAKIGITFSETALEGLPTDGPNHMGPEFNVLLPEQASKTPFTHVGINWNPQGHEPLIYGVPHFDFHFYTLEEKERSAITLQGDNMAKCQKKPSPKMMPKGYIYGPKTEVPYMGAHWVSLASPEFHGQGFTKTLIYGSYDGRVAFIEPMITMAYLETKPQFHGPLPQSESVAKNGFYPTEYGIVYDATRHEYTIELSKFVWRSRSKG